MSDAARLVTAAELERFPDDDYRYELVEGRLIKMSPVGLEHSHIVAQLMWLLMQYVRPRKLGFIGTELGFKLHSNPDTVRAPDVAFVRAERLPVKRSKRFWTGAPDLAIEVLSPDDRAADVRAKLEEYLGCGTPIVVIVDLVRRKVEEGHYSTEHEVVADALRLMQARDEVAEIKRARLKDAIDRGYEDAATGKVIRLESDDQIDAFFADL